ncbi:uncharacterized protein LOC130997018 [Salvia miltiorrhiza]|uniref:uncharacterized protein LOC130997018 n=1 Tax=Salvia miltiorrhiza TaxID=226208 RepID=UPI0025AC4DBD|nr:uncharacterized protein LOC130997018 [Salvia miltiorrhiza]
MFTAKGLVRYIKGEREHGKKLERRISQLIPNLEFLLSEKNRIDQSTEKTDFYQVMTEEIAVINNDCIELLSKYTKLTKNELSPTTSSLSIEMLNDVKSNAQTFKFRKLAKLSRDVAKLNKRASDAAVKLRPEHMIQKKARPNREKLDEDANALPVFDKYVDEIMEYLFDDEAYNFVGIHGREGAGKTTVLRKLYNRLLEESLSGDEEGLKLDHIIRIDYPPVSETEEDKNIVEILQQEIMEQLEIPHEGSKSIVRNANTISTFLCDKKYVLLMDHVSKSIDLEHLGVEQNHKDKKVVVCSSEKQVLRKMTEHNVEIRRLDKSEGMELIQNICGKLYDRKSDIAKRIIECCEGILLLIHLVAVELEDKKDDDSWNYMLRSLQSRPKSPELISLGPYAKVYEIKYEGLTADAKKCLLYSALFPLQHKISTDYLVECWIAEGFIAEEADQKVTASRERGQVILDKLTDDYLLQWHSGKKCVVMQPSFRRVALELDYPGEERCANWVPSKDRKPDEAVWATVRRMSLIGCKMELPKCPKCPNMYTLLLQSLKQEAERLPESFFAHMESLKVLDLNQMEITTLPGSIGKLVNLKSLYLNGCLGIVALPPEADRLVKLEFLDISGTSISTLPEVIGCMVNMRCLRASLSAKGGKQLEVIIPPGIISNLRNLEELSIVTDFDFQGDNGIAVAERLAKELADLEHLNTLCFNFPNVSSLETFVTNSKALKNKNTFWETQTFRSFQIFVGRHETPRRCQEPELSGMLAERWLRYSTNEEFSQSCEELLKQVSALEIIGHDGLKSFTGSPFDLDPVKVCVVERCNRLENIVDGYITCENPESLLPNLEKLYLYDLEMLKCIWDGPVPRKSLVNLTSITVDGCPELTKILDHGLAQSLEKLEYLKVENCGQISKIIEGSGEISEDVELLKRLKRIEVSNLPELECICENTSSISWKSLKSIIVKRCSKLRDLSLAYTNARKLPSIHCEESWWNTLISDDQLKLIRVYFIKDESIEAGAQSRREEASTSASGRPDAITAVSSMNIDYEVVIDDRPTSSSEKYEDEELCLEGKKMEHEHPAGTSAGASSTEVELQKENVDATPAENQGSGPISTSESKLVPKTFPVDSSSSSLSIFEIKDILAKTSEAKMPREIQEADDPRTSTDTKYSGEQRETEPTSSSNAKRSMHHEESIARPIYFQEEGHYLVVLKDNKHLQLEFNSQSFSIADHPSAVNPMLSLVEKDLHELPEKPNYPNSLILLLQRNKRLSLIHRSFFNTMPDLSFLDMSDTKIRKLPSSLFELSKLKVLLLRNCICLEKLPPEVRKLSSMEALDLSGSELYELPDEIGELTSLRSMQLSFYGPDDESEYEDLPSRLVSPSFLSELKGIEALSVSVHPEDQRWTESVAGILKDISRLERLSYLHFYFPQVETFESFIQTSPAWKKQSLRKFEFTVGQNVKRIASRVPDEVESLFSREERCLRYVNGDKVSPLIQSALTHVTSFYLDHHTEAQSLSEFDNSNFHELRFCLVRECPKMQAILDEENAGSAFPCLEYLGIYFLWELKQVWKPAPQAGRVKRIFKTATPLRSFEALRYLTISTCPKLRFILWESMLQCFANLEELVVEDCERVEEIIKEEKKKVKYENNALPGLRKLVLRYLPELVGLGCGIRLSEEKISVYGCPKLIPNS